MVQERKSKSQQSLDKIVKSNRFSKFDWIPIFHNILQGFLSAYTNSARHLFRFILPVFSWCLYSLKAFGSTKGWYKANIYHIDISLCISEFCRACRLWNQKLLFFLFCVFPTFEQRNSPIIIIRLILWLFLDILWVSLVFLYGYLRKSDIFSLPARNAQKQIEWQFSTWQENYLFCCLYFPVVIKWKIKYDENVLISSKLEWLEWLEFLVLALLALLV